MVRKNKNEDTMKHEDYVYLKYDRDNLFRECIMNIHCYNWGMRNYETEDCSIEVYDKTDNDKIHNIQFDPAKWIISFDKNDIEKMF